MQNELWAWLAIIGLTLVTILCRSAFLMFGERVNLPPRLQRSLRYAPAMALVAIIVPDLFIRQHVITLDFSNDRLLAGLFAILVFVYTRSMLATIFLGMAALTLLRWIY